MRIPRIFYPAKLVSNQNIVLTEEASNHLIRVLRLSKGSPLILFNGEGGEYAAEIIGVAKKDCVVRVDQFSDKERESPLIVKLAQGISRGDKMDFVIQKAVELGINQIIPLYTQYSEARFTSDRKEKRLRHWRNIVINSCEQCGRNQLPSIAEPSSLNDFLINPDGEVKLILHPYAAPIVLSEITAPSAITLLIGPEGGFSEPEVAKAIQSGFKSIALGPRILRTETAPLAILSILQHLFGDF